MSDHPPLQEPLVSQPQPADTGELEPSPRMVVLLSQLLLCTTVFCMLVGPFLVKTTAVWMVVVAIGPYGLLYGACWYLAATGRARKAAWAFLIGTWLGQTGALVTNIDLSDQALVSGVNLVLFAGFTFGRRLALWVSGVCIAMILIFSVSSLQGWLPEPMIEVTPAMGVLALIATLVATGGLTFVGIQHKTEAIHRAQLSEAKMAAANRALKLASGSDERRALRAERIGTLAKGLVGMNEPTGLSQEVAIGLRDALGADIVLVLEHTGKLIAAAGLGTVQEGSSLQVEVDVEMNPGSTRDLSKEQLMQVSQLAGLESLTSGCIMRAPHAPFFMLAAGGSEWIGLHEAAWTLQVSTNLLDAALGRHESELRMLQAQKMDALHRLSSGIAHDFNNLLTTILGGAEIAEFQAGTQAPVRGHLKRIRKAAQRASALTSKLMTFSREAARAPEAMDLGQVLSDLLPVLRRTVEENIEFVIHMDDATGLWVDGDSLDIERVMFNLVANARDAIDGKGQIDIGAELRPGNPDRVVLWVQDDGEGMATEVRARMFEPFFTTRRGTGASGLGMSIVYGVVQGIGGEVFVDSTQGSGTCVEIHFGLVEEPDQLPQAAVPSIDEVAGLRVLVVEDAEDVRETLCEMLEMGGYTVDSVPSAAEALALLGAQSRWQLVLSDVVMPEMGGFELAVEMEARGIDTPIALVSGYAARSDADIRSRALPRITKPFSLDALLAFVGQHAQNGSIPAEQ